MIPVSWSRDAVKETQLLFGDESLISIHHLVRCVSQRLLQITLTEKLGVDEISYLFGPRPLLAARAKVT